MTVIYFYPQRSRHAGPVGESRPCPHTGLAARSHLGPCVDKPSARQPAMSACFAAGHGPSAATMPGPRGVPPSACDAGAQGPARIPGAVAFATRPAARVKWKDITGAGKTTTTMTGPRWLLLLTVAVFSS